VSFLVAPQRGEVLDGLIWREHVFSAPKAQAK